MPKTVTREGAKKGKKTKTAKTARQAKAGKPSASPAATFAASLARFDAKTQALFKAVRTAMRKRVPTANELAYDYGRSVLIAYSASERGIEGFASIAAREDGVRLYLNAGPRIPDPGKRLKGSGSSARYMTVESAKQLAEPEIEAMIAAAISLSKVPLAGTGKGALIIRTSADK